jgi:ABC-type polysaccharide/polyol phosphate export permease
MTSFAGHPVLSDQARGSRLRMLWHYRELMWMLAWRDIRVRYTHSVLGAAWAVVPPLMMMITFAFIFGTVMELDPSQLTGHKTLPYGLFALCGLVPWTFFANGLTAAVSSLVSNRQLVTKIYFPREVFPLAAIGSSLVDFLVSGVLLACLIVWYHFTADGWTFRFSWMLAWTPIVVLVQLVLMIGLGLLLSMANLFYRDVALLFRAVIQLWMFVTCVLYRLEATDGWKRVVIQLNPMTPIIRAYRDCVFMGSNPFDRAFFGAALMACLIFIVGAWAFSRREDEFAVHI